MKADTQTTAAIAALVDETYRALSTPGYDFGDLFGHADMTVVGSGQGEVFRGHDETVSVAQIVASRGLTWVPTSVDVWEIDDVAWALILGQVELVEGNGSAAVVPYTTTGLFGHESDGWHWLYWGGAEPQENPRV